MMIVILLIMAVILNHALWSFIRIARWISGNEASRSIPVEAVHCWCSLSGIKIVLKSFCRECKNMVQHVGRWGSRLWRFAFKIVFCCKAHHHLKHDNGRLSNPHHWRLAIPSHTIMAIILVILLIIMTLMIIMIIMIIVMIRTTSSSPSSSGLPTLLLLRPRRAHSRSHSGSVSSLPLELLQSEKVVTDINDDGNDDDAEKPALPAVVEEREYWGVGWVV